MHWQMVWMIWHQPALYLETGKTCIAHFRWCWHSHGNKTWIQHTWLGIWWKDALIERCWMTGNLEKRGGGSGSGRPAMTSKGTRQRSSWEVSSSSSETLSMTKKLPLAVSYVGKQRNEQPSTLEEEWRESWLLTQITGTSSQHWLVILVMTHSSRVLSMILSSFPSILGLTLVWSDSTWKDFRV